MSLILNASRFISAPTARLATKSFVQKCSLWRQSSNIVCAAIRKNIVPVVSGLTLTGGITVSAVWRNRALCEYRPKKSRLLDDSHSKELEAKFDWREFFRLLWPDVWYLLGAVVSALAVALVNIQIPLMLGQLVNVVSSQTDVEAFVKEMRGPAMKLVNMYLLQSGLTSVYISLLSCVGERLAARLRTKLFASIIQQDIAFFDKNKTGEIVNRLTADVQEFKSAFKQVISQGLRSITQTVGCVVSLLLLSPRLTAVLVLVVPSMVGVGTLLGAGLRSLSREAQAQVAKATAVADEAIGNVRTVRAFAMEDKEIELYSEEVLKSSQLQQSLGIGIGVFQGLSNAALNGVVLGTLYLGGYLMARQDIRPGDLMAFMVSTQTVQRSLAQVSLLLGSGVRGMSAGARVFEYISLQSTMPMKGGATIPYHTMHGEVCFNNVQFTYPTRPEQKVLDDFSLKVPGGRVVALVGHSGGGKSTIASLLERFYDVDSGSITIDGYDIKSLDPSWLRGKAIGFINQEPVLFATSVMENIRYGYPDATDTEVIEAAKLANAHDFIEGFPQGYHTVLGERGVTVSGGQKQRIAIARALIKRPTVLILDEATSALDSESEKVVQEALDNVVKGRTTLVIAHRLSTVRNADLIAVVAGGHIKEIGTHEELKRRKGLYWDLIQHQDTAEKKWFE